MPASRGSSYGTGPRFADGDEPGDHTVSRWLSGAPQGCVSLPTRGDFGSFSSDRGAGKSLPCVKRVSTSRPYGWNGMRRLPRPRMNKRGTSQPNSLVWTVGLYAGPKAGTPAGGLGGIFT